MSREIKTGEQKYMKWEKPGDVLEGKLLRIEQSKDATYKGWLLFVRTASNERYFAPAPTMLLELINDAGLVGRFVRIEFTHEDTTKKGTKLKQFTVRVQDDDDDIPPGDPPY